MLRKDAVGVGLELLHPVLGLCGSRKVTQPFGAAVTSTGGKKQPVKSCGCMPRCEPTNKSSKARLSQAVWEGNHRAQACETSTQEEDPKCKASLGSTVNYLKINK